MVEVELEAEAVAVEVFEDAGVEDEDQIEDDHEAVSVCELYLGLSAARPATEAAAKAPEEDLAWWRR